ncbi:alpha/beta hydrolase [Chitinophaga sp. Cy-1792]|uniref:alpha/beta hydrolase n=1 Tax=Chitinophaga sp. Cy-1792 TaxID=2608339 RepID=UPI00141F1EFF|nr:alpha/beta hydrolase [Chitinophaga sp. Cy-1792]NIG53409.1 alpha/beta hydrolase [Chitinophaga sp. Cy-1792]
MKTGFLLSLLLATGSAAMAQSQARITNQPDTSFTNYSAYTHNKKAYPQIAMVNESIPSDIKKQQYTYRGALQISSYSATKKVKKKRLPAIIIVHGGGWRSGSPDQHQAMAVELALRGYVTFTPQYSLSTTALYPAAVNDIKAAITWVKQHAADWHIDTARIALAGFSAGGQLAGLVANSADNSIFLKDSTYSNSVSALVSIDGVMAFIHPESAEGNDSKGPSAGTLWFGYTKDEQPALWHQASALNYAGKNSPPTLFLNSEHPRFHAGRDDYRKILSQYNIYTEVHEFQGPHPFCLFHPWFNNTVQDIDIFLKKVMTN